MSEYTHYKVQKNSQTPTEVLHSTNEPTNSSLDILKKKLRINILSLNEFDIEFEIIGIDASIANALRRIMLSEVPTVAAEHIYINDNSSIIQDEVLAHRIGLIPLAIDPSKISYVVDDDYDDQNTVVFSYDIECTNEIVGENKVTKEPIYLNEMAKTNTLKWEPQGYQAETMFPDGVRPVHEDIVIAKLRPGQRIQFEAHCVKGIGKDHTKFSPSATASYRLQPDIVLKEEVNGELAEQLKKMCPMDVFDIEDTVAVVKRPKDCTMCRECIRLDGWDKRVELKRIADHFIFSVESSGAIPPVKIVTEALSVLRKKAETFIALTDEYIMGV